MTNNTIEMRAALAACLDEALQGDERIVVLDADLGRANGTLKLKEKHPERALNVGIAEANMTSIAAGLSAYGFIPFISTFCAFVTRRNCDQVAISVAYAGRNVKIVGTDPGVGAELNGGTHMSVEDVGIMRAIPGIVIFEPVDAAQLVKAMPHIIAHEGPVYIRLFRKVAPVTLFDREDYEFSLGKAELLREGMDVTIAASGIEVKEALDAAALLAEEGLSAEVINLHTIKPLDEDALCASVQRTGCLVTAENHNVIGGLGSACAEALARKHPAPQEFIGFQDSFGEVGPLSYLKERFALDAQSIVKAAKRAISRKASKA